MGWSTSVVSPPDGDMGHYLSSLGLLLDRDDRIFLPAHGPAIDDPKPFVRAFIEHRREREAQVVACLQQGVGHIPDMVSLMYQGVPTMLHAAAARSVFAHVLHMLDRGLVQSEAAPSLSGHYSLR